jgi:hypothetical protein
MVQKGNATIITCKHNLTCGLLCRVNYAAGTGDGLRISAAQYAKAYSRRANAQNFADK